MEDFLDFFFKDSMKSLTRTLGGIMSEEKKKILFSKISMTKENCQAACYPQTSQVIPLLKQESIGRLLPLPFEQSVGITKI